MTLDLSIFFIVCFTAIFILINANIILTLVLIPLVIKTKTKTRQIIQLKRLIHFNVLIFSLDNLPCFFFKKDF